MITNLIELGDRAYRWLMSESVAVQEGEWLVDPDDWMFGETL